MTKLDLLKDWYQRVYIDGDLEAIDDYFAPRSTASGLMAELQVGPEDFRELIPAVMRLIREPEVVIDAHLDSGDWLWALVTVKAKSTRSLSPVEFSGQVMMRVQEGRIAEAFNHFDFITFFEQLELLPPQTFALCLSGERLH
ncbi:nuclear transport factor 2 family protein [Ostreiculturibacter nitratireducens]|uniref:nuclear transport factor 2 family protein n=1 Tax=Ostreiculturibacter nitratireducens TaxID=3075226 RepID=UPI0031B58319